jgi:apolipoprotein N-acyltransferase
MEQLDAIFERAELYVQLITPLRFEYANNQVKLLSESLGFGHDQLKYILCLLGAYPLAMIYRTLPTASTKHLFDVIVGILIAQFVFSTQWIHSFLCAFITYFLVKFGPAKYAPQISFAFNMVLINTVSFLYFS